jgi:hypothetical protein
MSEAISGTSAPHIASLMQATGLSTPYFRSTCIMGDDGCRFGSHHRLSYSVRRN